MAEKKGKGLDRKETITGIKAIWEAVKSYWGQYLRNNLVEKIIQEEQFVTLLDMT